VCTTSRRFALSLCGASHLLHSSCSCSYSCNWSCSCCYKFPFVSFLWCDLSLVMHLSFANSSVFLSCIPSIGFEKKNISIFYQGFLIARFLL
jgi:hypothetical protein